MKSNHKPSYLEHLDTITALVSFLAVTDYKSLTPSGIASGLSLPKEDVINALDSFKSLFRKSKNKSADNNEHYYTLHLRYGLRKQISDSSDTSREPLNHEYITALFDFISRKAENEQMEIRSRSSNKIGLFSAWGTAIITLIIAVASIANNYSLQNKNLDFQQSIKQYEVSFKPKQEGYSNFMAALYDAFRSAYSQDKEKTLKKIEKLESIYYSVELFLVPGERKKIWDEMHLFAGFCHSLSETDHNNKEKMKGYYDSFWVYRDSFRDKLLKSLFNKNV